MSISKFFKEAVLYRVLGGHTADHKAMGVPTISLDTNGNVSGVVSPTGAVLYGKSTYDLSQSAIPLVIPPSSTIGANGAITFGTAFRAAYANAFMYFPSGSIGSGVAAGMYLVKMSDATHGTIYNNQLITNSPVVPTVLVPFSGTAGSSMIQTVGTFIPVLSMLILGNTLGPNGGVEIVQTVSCNTTATSKTYGCQINGNWSNAIGLSSTNGGSVQTSIRNRGVTNSQFSVNSNYGDYGSGTAGFGVINNFSVDTTAVVTLSLNLQLTVATDWIVFESYRATVYPKA